MTDQGLTAGELMVSGTGDDVSEVPQLAACGAEGAAIVSELVDGSAGVLPGQVAEVRSHLFSSAAPDQVSGLDADEFVGAMVIVTDGSATADVDSLLDLMSDSSFAACMETAMHEQFSAEAAERGVEVQVTVTAADPRVGDNSAAFDLAITLDAESPLNILVESVLARSGNHVVVVTHGVAFTEAALPIDLGVEAKLLIAALSGA